MFMGATRRPCTNDLKVGRNSSAFQPSKQEWMFCKHLNIKGGLLKTKPYFTVSQFNEHTPGERKKKKRNYEAGINYVWDHTVLRSAIFQRFFACRPIDKLWSELIVWLVGWEKALVQEWPGINVQHLRMHLELTAARRTVNTWHAVMLSAGLMKLCFRWSLLAYNFLLLCIFSDCLLLMKSY